MVGTPRRTLLAGAVGLLASPAVVRAQSQGNGVALVIGNSKYRWEASLPNVKRDAPDVAKRFQALGMKTELLQDLGREAMVKAIEKFGEASRGAKLAAFYFAGHGVTWDRQTFIVPVDADLSDSNKLLDLVRLPSVIAASKNAGARLLVFDSCRNNPADGWRQREAKDAAGRVAGIDIAAAAGRENSTLLLFSTVPGGTALDGPAGENSPFAAAFLRQLDGQSVELQGLPPSMRRDLLLATEGKQMLYTLSSYSDSFLRNVTGRAAPRSSGPRHDPSRVVELSNAYIYAQQNGLILPGGLVAYRPSNNNAADSQKIGSYKYDSPVRTGQSGGNQLMPALLIVLCAADSGSAEMVLSEKDYGAEYTSAGGTYWKFVTATKTENAIAWFTKQDGNKFEFKWRDQNSGMFSISASSRPPSRFTRLDG